MTHEKVWEKEVKKRRYCERSVAIPDLKSYSV